MPLRVEIQTKEARLSELEYGPRPSLLTQMGRRARTKKKRGSLECLKATWHTEPRTSYCFDSLLLAFFDRYHSLLRPLTKDLPLLHQESSALNE